MITIGGKRYWFWSFGTGIKNLTSTQVLVRVYQYHQYRYWFLNFHQYPGTDNEKFPENPVFSSLEISINKLMSSLKINILKRILSLINLSPVPTSTKKYVFAPVSPVPGTDLKFFTSTRVLIF